MVVVSAGAHPARAVCEVEMLADRAAGVRSRRVQHVWHGEHFLNEKRDWKKAMRQGCGRGNGLGHFVFGEGWFEARARLPLAKGCAKTAGPGSLLLRLLRLKVAAASPLASPLWGWLGPVDADRGTVQVDGPAQRPHQPRGDHHTALLTVDPHRQAAHASTTATRSTGKRRNLRTPGESDAHLPASRSSTSPCTIRPIPQGGPAAQFRRHGCAPPHRRPRASGCTSVVLSTSWTRRHG